MGNKRSRARVRRYAKKFKKHPANITERVIGVRGSGEKLADAQRRRNLYMHGSEGHRRRVLREISHATYVDYVEDELPQDPKKAKKLVKIANEYRKLDMFSNATRALGDAHRCDKKNGKILYNLTISCLDLKRSERVTRTYAEKLGRIKGWRGRSEYILGTMDYQRDSWLTAKRHLLLFVRNPGTAGTTLHSGRLGDAYGMLATCSQKLGETDDKQFELLKLTLRYDPPPKMLYNTLMKVGLYHTVLEEWETAAEFYRKAVNIKRKGTGAIPSNLGARMNLAMSLRMLGESAEALRVIKKAIRMEPKMFLLFVAKADILFETGKLQLALEAINYALWFGDAHADVQELWSRWERAPEGSVQALQLKSDIQDEIGDWAGLYETNMAISKLSKDVDVQKEAIELMARSLHRRKKHGKAIKLLDQALEQYGTYWEALRAMYNIAMETGDFPTAVKFANRLIKDHPSITHTSLKAEALIFTKKFGEALKLTRKIMKSKEINPDLAGKIVSNMIGIVLGTRDKEHYKMLESLCNRFIQKFRSHPDKTILIACYEGLNWLNAINGKEKEFQKLLLTTKKLSVKPLWRQSNEGIKIVNDGKANTMYNFACGFAVAGNKTMAMKCLKIADKMNPDMSYAKMSKSDPDFLNIKK